MLDKKKMLTIVRVELLTNFIVLTQRNESSLLTTYCTLIYHLKKRNTFVRHTGSYFRLIILFVCYFCIYKHDVNQFLDIVRHRTTVQVYVVAFIFCIELINIFFLLFMKCICLINFIY